jgi:hypothetical protein
MRNFEVNLKTFSQTKIIRSKFKKKKKKLKK